MFDNTVTRYSGGVSNLRENATLSDMGVPDRIGKYHEYSQDFDQYVSGDWTSTGAGSAALASGDGGLLAITSPVSTFQSLQDNPGSFVNVQGFRTWGRATFKLDSLLGTVLVGLLNTTTTPFTAASQTDGMYFLSAVTTGALNFNIAVGGTITTVATGVSLVAGSYTNCLFYYDGALYGPGQPNGRVIWTVSGAGATGNVKGEILISASSTFPGSTVVTPTMAVNASTAVARVLTVDALYFAKDRTSINATPVF